MKLSVVAPTGGPPSALSIPTPALLDSERTLTRRRGFSEGEQASSNEAWSGNSTTNRRGAAGSESKRPAWVIPVLVVIGVLATAALVVAMLMGGGHSVRLGAGKGQSAEATTEQWSDPRGGLNCVRECSPKRNYGRFAKYSSRRESPETMISSSELMRVDEFAYSKRCLGWRIASTLTP